MTPRLAAGVSAVSVPEMWGDNTVQLATTTTTTSTTSPTASPDDPNGWQRLVGVELPAAGSGAAIRYVRLAPSDTSGGETYFMPLGEGVG